MFFPEIIDEGEGDKGFVSVTNAANVAIVDGRPCCWNLPDTTNADQALDEVLAKARAHQVTIPQSGLDYRCAGIAGPNKGGQIEASGGVGIVQVWGFRSDIPVGAAVTATDDVLTLDASTSTTALTPLEADISAAATAHPRGTTVAIALEDAAGAGDIAGFIKRLGT